MNGISKMIQRDIDMLQNRINELEKQNEIMREALQFYSDGNGECETDSELMPPDERFPFEGEQMGKRARRALERVK